jgi:hypothetical protein
MCFALLGLRSFALDVDREELFENTEESVEFVDFEGEPSKVETEQEIRGIGAALAAALSTADPEAAYFDRYSVIHAVDSFDPNGLDADIFFINEQAEVATIGALRLILSSYLSAEYELSESDANLLAELVSIYNAIRRGNLTFFEERYKQIVLDNLTAENVGLALVYSEWPGATEMVIPLSEPGGVAGINPFELGDPGVIEELRLNPEMGIEERKALVALMEEAIEREEEAIAEEREQIEEEREQIAAEREAAEQEPDEAPDEPTEEPSEPEPAEDTDEPADDADEPSEAGPADEAQAEEPAPDEEVDTPAERTEAERQAREEELDRQEQDLEEREEAVEEQREQVREQRDQIARDQAETIDDEEEADAEEAAAVEPVSVLQTRRQEGRVLSRIVRVNPVTSERIASSDVDTITNRRTIRYGTERNVLAVALSGSDAARLVLIDPVSLETLVEGGEEIHPDSDLDARNGEIFAVVEAEGDWYLGRFDDDLGLLRRSQIAVTPTTAFTFVGGNVWVQTFDNRLVPLLVEDLRVSR